MRIALLVLLAVMVFGCAHAGPDPCIGSFEARKTMKCNCPGTLDPACPPWPSDAYRKKVAAPPPS